MNKPQKLHIVVVLGFNFERFESNTPNRCPNAPAVLQAQLPQSFPAPSGGFRARAPHCAMVHHGTIFRENRCSVFKLIFEPFVVLFHLSWLGSSEDRIVPGIQELHDF